VAGTTSTGTDESRKSRWGRELVCVEDVDFNIGRDALCAQEQDTATRFSNKLSPVGQQRSGKKETKISLLKQQIIQTVSTRRWKEIHKMRKPSVWVRAVSTMAGTCSRTLEIGDRGTVADPLVGGGKLQMRHWRPPSIGE